MDPITGILLGMSIGITRERLYTASKKNLNKTDTAKFVLKGFTRELVAIKDLFGGEKKPKSKVYRVEVPGGLSQEEEKKHLKKSLDKFFNKKENPEVQGEIKEDLLTPEDIAVQPVTA